MRGLRWFGLVALVLLFGAADLSADEGDGGAGRPDALTTALESLRLRMDARLKEGELLSKTGRIEEALEAYRSVGDIYERGMAEIRDMLAQRGATPAAPPAPVEGPSDVPFRTPPFVSNRPVEGTDASKSAKQAVERGLRWLAAHQSPNGGWSAAGFGQWCDGKPVSDAARKPDGLGKSLYDPGVSGLALVAFLGAGYTNRGKHEYAKVVSRGLRYLKNIQDPEGCFGPRSTQQYIYNHAMCALAMVEAYGMTGSPIFKGSAQRALDFIALSRNPYFGWRYGIKPGDNDTSVTAWMIMCLASARATNQDAIRHGRPAPLTIDEAAFDGAKAWLDKVTDPDYGRVGYIQRGTGPARPQDLVDRFPGEKSESMTAAGMLTRIHCGEDPSKSRIIRKGADLCLRLAPVWNLSDGSIDMYYWYHGTLAMFQVGGAYWQRWSAGVQRAVVNSQRRDTDPCQFAGSWDPVGPWGLDGGRVFSTALMTLVSEVQARYVRAGK